MVEEAAVTELALKRRWLTTISTIGELTVDGAPECFILEDRYRPPPEPKVPRETCIPIGRYEVIWSLSPRFRRKTLRLVGVPGFIGILIHGGNDALDTEGCLLTGRTRGENYVGESQLALHALEAKVVPRIEAGEKCFITVTVEPH